MKRNKKNQVIRKTTFSTVLAFSLVSITALGLSYLWLCSRCDSLGKEIKRKEVELLVVQKRLVNEQDHWSYMTSPVNLSRAIKRHKLGMIMPHESQIVRVRFHKDEGLSSLAYNE